MQIALPYTRATLLRLWAWWRGDVEALAPLAALRFSLERLSSAVDEMLPPYWLIGEPLGEATETGVDEATLTTALAALPGVSWARLSVDGGDNDVNPKDLDNGVVATLTAWNPATDAALGPPLGRVPLRRNGNTGNEEAAFGESLPLPAYLLVLPWEGPPRVVRDAVLAIRGTQRAQQVVRDLAAVASTEVLEGARATAGIPGPWPGEVPRGPEDMWLRISDPPRYLLERWLLHSDDDTAGTLLPPRGDASMRVYWYAAPQQPGQAPLWCLWGYEPALATEMDFGLGAGAGTAQRLLFLAPRESPRAVASAAFTSLAERLEVAQATAPEIHTLAAAAPPQIPVPVTVRPRSHESVPPRMWLVSEERLLANPAAVAGLERVSRRNLTVAACADRNGAAQYLLSERVQRRSPELVEWLGQLAEPLVEVKGLANVFLAAGYHLLPEVRSETLQVLVFRAANSAGIREAFYAEADEKQRAFLDNLARETELPLAIITREAPESGAMLRATPLPGPSPSVAATPAEVADPWGAVADDNETPATSAVAPPAPRTQTPSSDAEAAAEWCVYFVPASAFHNFDRLVEMLRREEAERIQRWQRHTPIILPAAPTT